MDATGFPDRGQDRKTQSLPVSRDLHAMAKIIATAERIQIKDLIAPILLAAIQDRYRAAVAKIGGLCSSPQPAAANE